MAHTLYMIHGSHPCAAVELALQLKRQPYRRHELIPALHIAQQWLRFRATTVPVLVLGSGEEVVGSRAICHRLDELAPDPPLLPADPDGRARVLEAERWGDEVLQPIPRRLFWVAARRRPQAIVSYARGSSLPLPELAQRMAVPVVGRISAARNRASKSAVRADLAALPGLLDRVDAWIAEGLLGGMQPNAADLQIASSVRLLSTFADLRSLLEDRPALALAQRLFPVYDGEMPAGALPDAPRA